MSGALWFLLVGIVFALGLLLRHTLRKWQARSRAEEDRIAQFMALNGGALAPAATPAAPAPAARPAAPKAVDPAPAGDTLAVQKLLFDAAHKAGAAGEPALAIQLYARLLARFPASGLAEPARNAVESQKKRLLKV
jgi:TolA-binding protein